MPISGQGKNAQQPKKSMWDEAIADAKRRIKELQFTVRVYKQRRDKGEPWPGDQSQSAGSV